MDQKAFDDGFILLKEYVDREMSLADKKLAALTQENKALREEIAELRSQAPRDGIDGKSVSPEDVAPMLEDMVQKAVSAIPAPKDGRDGQDIDPEAVLKHAETITRDFLSALPVPKDGRDGLDGKSVSIEDIAPIIEQIAKTIPVPRDGVDGKSVDMAEIRDMVAKAVAEIPTPKDGIDGKDGSSVDMAEIERLIASEAQKAVSDLPKPRDGIDGKSVTLEEVQPFIDEQISKAVAQIPAPKDGKDGVDGKSVAVEDVAPLISEEVSKAVAAIPLPENGKDGADADMEAVLKHAESVAREAVSQLPVPQDGKDGTSVTIDDVLPLVQKAFEALPVPRDGIDGKSVTIDEIAPLVTSEVTKAVSALPVPKDGKDGSDGIGIAEALKDADGQLVLTMTDGTVKKVGSMVGPAGKDGFSLKDFDVEQIDDGRTLLFSFDDGHIKQSVEIDFPISIYRGIYQEGKEAKRGDCFTWAGSVWHCEETTTEKPGEGSKSWRLAVKRGRDGKDFAGPQAPPSGKVKL